MKILCLTHVPFEGPGAIADYATQKNMQIEILPVYKSMDFPSSPDFDLLLVMGGPMGIYDEQQYPWLKAEKQFIKRCIDDGKKVLGICLGAQLIAGVLGAEVKPNAFKEIGWFPIRFHENSQANDIFSPSEESPEVFHWHGDTFDLPAGATLLASSEGCTNQAFILNDKVIGLQFHLESTADSIRNLTDNCAAEIKEDRYIQSVEEILSRTNQTKQLNRMMFSLLEYFFEIARS